MESSGSIYRISSPMSLNLRVARDASLQIGDRHGKAGSSSPLMKLIQQDRATGDLHLPSASQDADSQEVEVCPAVHFSFDHFDSVHMTLRATDAPGMLYRIAHLLLILFQSCCKAGDCRRGGLIHRNAEPMSAACFQCVSPQSLAARALSAPMIQTHRHARARRSGMRSGDRMKINLDKSWLDAQCIHIDLRTGRQQRADIPAASLTKPRGRYQPDQDSANLGTPFHQG